MKYHFIIAGLVLLSACRARQDGDDAVLLDMGGENKIEVCTNNYNFFGTSKDRFDFKAESLSLSNAYWLSAFSSHVYLNEGLLQKEVKRLGFEGEKSNDLMSENHFEAVDRNAEMEKSIFSKIRFKYLDSQAFIVENKDGIILSFRGSEKNQHADLLTDLWFNQLALAPSQLVEVGKVLKSVPSDPVEREYSIEVHNGFWAALDIIWEPINKRIYAQYAAQVKKEKPNRMVLLDRWAKMLSQGQRSNLESELSKETGWHIPLEGKKKLIKTWSDLGNNAQRRDDLFNVIFMKWPPKIKPIWITGHSLGGALANLAAYRLLLQGIPVKGLYTYGAPRIGNHAFAHDFKVRAYEEGLKTFGGDGGIARFMNHHDIVSRMPPLIGWASAFDDSPQNPFLDKWEHSSRMHYLTGSESVDQELWVGMDKRYEEKFKDNQIKEYASQMPLEHWKKFRGDHDIVEYTLKLEDLAFKKRTPCSQF